MQPDPQPAQFERLSVAHAPNTGFVLDLLGRFGERKSFWLQADDLGALAGTIDALFRHRAQGRSMVALAALLATHTPTVRMMGGKIVRIEFGGDDAAYAAFRAIDAATAPHADPADVLSIPAAPPSLPFAAEQLVDFVAEAVALIGVASGQPHLHDSHMDSPSYRLARAAGVTPKCLRDAVTRTVRPDGAN